jgi:hypothetical protein
VSLTALQELGVERDIDELIDRLAEDHDGRDFIEALEIMLDRTQTALNARREELGED